jgi:acyl-CoA hydrolase
LNSFVIDPYFFCRFSFLHFASHNSSVHICWAAPPVRREQQNNNYDNNGPKQIIQSMRRVPSTNLILLVASSLQQPRPPFASVIPRRSAGTTGGICPEVVPLISGCNDRLVRNVTDTIIKCTDFVGSPSAVDQQHPQRLAGGEMLGLMDVTAAGVALHHVTGKRFQLGAPPEGFAARVAGDNGEDGDSATLPTSVSVATIGVDNTCFVAPVLHGDVVEMTGRVVHAGSSSIGVFIQAHRLPFLSAERTLVGEAFFSMVAIDKKLQAAKVVPAVALSSPQDRELHKRYKEIRDAQKRNEAYFHQLETKGPNIDTDEINAFVECGDDPNSTTHHHHQQPLLARIPVSHTVTEANRHFNSAHLNINNTIFGGEILRWMEAHATYCGRKFARNRHVYSIGMHTVSFNHPIFPTDWVSLRARVALTRKATMEVDVRLTVEREGSPLMTNRASFVLINTDEVGLKCPLMTGISLQGEDERVVRHVAMAKHRYLCQKRVYENLKHYHRDQQ